MLAAAVINPRRVRNFAKAIGLDAKTDPIDAKVISRYVEVVVPKPMPTQSDHELKHSALVARRCQLLELINQENNRLKQSRDDDAKKSIRDVLKVLKKQLKSVDSLLVQMLAKGKESKVAIVACMRKLVTILNLLVKTNQTWQT